MRISGGDSYWAEEIVQRTFVRLWEIHDQVSPDKSLISYLCTIAKNLLMNVYQRQTVEYIYAEYVLESSEEYSDNADGELDGKLLEEYIDRLAEELPPSRKKIFVLSKRKHLANNTVFKNLLGLLMGNDENGLPVLWNAANTIDLGLDLLPQE